MHTWQGLRLIVDLLMIGVIVGLVAGECECWERGISGGQSQEKLCPLRKARNRYNEVITTKEESFLSCVREKYAWWVVYSEEKKTGNCAILDAVLMLDN